MLTICSDTHRLHFPQGELYGGQFVRPFECPERHDYILQALDAAGHHERRAPDALDRTLLAAVHDTGYLDFLQSAWREWQAAGYTGEALPNVVPARRMQQREPAHIDGRLGYYAMAIETAITAGTWQAAEASAAIAQTGADVLSDGAPLTFSLCRPPGHHAATDLYGGYCFLNNAAIAAQRLLDRGASRVALLDVDFHHGNGTQDIFYQRDDVLFLSLHGDPVHAFPHFLGYADETGQGAGEGYTVNFPLPPGTPYSIWSHALRNALQRIAHYAPDALVVSLGVDTFEKDPISFFALTSDDFTRYGEEIARLKLPTLVVMEGGYAVEEIGTNTVNVLNGMLSVGRNG